MAIPVSGKTYRFNNVGAPGRRLNLYSSGTASNGMNVVLYTADNTNEQQWLYSGGRLLIKTATGFCLDRYNLSSNANHNNADIWTVSSAEDANQKITFVDNGSYVKIKLASTSLYLTARSNANGTGTGKTTTSAGNVYWAASSTSTLQQWTFTEVSGGSTGGTGSTPVNPPTSIESVNIMQRYNKPLTFTGTNITIKDVEQDGTTESYHRGSGFRPSESGKKFLDTANGATVLSTVRNFAKTVYNLTSLPSRYSCSYYLFGEYSSGIYYHHGVDMNIQDGAAIRAFWGGELVSKGGSLGAVRIYIPSLGVTTSYLHMKSIPSSLVEGQQVNANTIIGYQSNVGAGSSHLHFEVRAGRNQYSGDNYASASSKALTSIIPYGYMKK